MNDKGFLPIYSEVLSILLECVGKFRLSLINSGSSLNNDLDIITNPKTIKITLLTFFTRRMFFGVNFCLNCLANSILIISVSI